MTVNYSASQKATIMLAAIEAMARPLPDGMGGIAADERLVATPNGPAWEVRFYPQMASLPPWSAMLTSVAHGSANVVECRAQAWELLKDALTKPDVWREMAEALRLATALLLGEKVFTKVLEAEQGQYAHLRSLEELKEATRQAANLWDNAHDRAYTMGADYRQRLQALTTGLHSSMGG